MRKLILLLAALPALAQQQQPSSAVKPDCQIFFFFTGASTGAQAALTPVNGTAGVSGVIDNRDAGCSGWTMTYSNFGFSAVSVLFQSAPNGSAAVPSATGVPGTWAAFAGAIVTGVNPSLSITQTEVTATGYFPFVRVNMTSKTGSGIVIGELHGFKSNANAGGGGGGGSGCLGTSVTPCVVDGPTAAGLAPVFPPVLIAGQTGTAISPGTLQTLHTDADGNLQVQLIGNGTVLSDQQSVTASAVALGTHTVRSACVKALVSNSINVFVGPSGITTATGFLLAPGESTCLGVTNTNLLFVIASTTGASVSWIATN